MSLILQPNLVRHIKLTAACYHLVHRLLQDCITKMVMVFPISLYQYLMIPGSGGGRIICHPQAPKTISSMLPLLVHQPPPTYLAQATTSTRRNMLLLVQPPTYPAQANSTQTSMLLLEKIALLAELSHLAPATSTRTSMQILVEFSHLAPATSIRTSMLLLV